RLTMATKTKAALLLPLLLLVAVLVLPALRESHRTVYAAATRPASAPPATLASSTLAPSQSPASIPRAARVIVISIDGLRPDLLLRGDMPTARALMAAGSFTMFARTIADPYTLPAHVSMLTGVPPEPHGITWNDYTEDSYPDVPTLFDLAKKN